MLNVSENELLTRTGPGTPMGELFRRFWHPVLLAEELPEPDGMPVRLRGVTQWLLPTFSLIPASDFPRGGRCWIPIDDTHISVIQYSYHPERPLTDAEIQRGKNSPEVAPSHYRLPDGAIIDICRDVRNADNDYLIDRAMQGLILSRITFAL